MHADCTKTILPKCEEEKQKIMLKDMFITDMHKINSELFIRHWILDYQTYFVFVKQMKEFAFFREVSLFT